VALEKARRSSRRLTLKPPRRSPDAYEASNINAYLVAGRDIDIKPSKKSVSGTAYMDLGNMPKDGGNLLLSFADEINATSAEPAISRFVYDFVGSQEYVKGIVRRCLWIEDSEVADALRSEFIAARLEGVQKMRLESDAESTRAFANRPHRFKQIQGRGVESSIVVPKVTSESRPYLPVGLLSQHSIVSDNAFALYDAPLWNMALIASRLHLVWIATVCGKLETRYRYSNTLGWNTFPVPPLTEKNKADLTRCAEDILLAREAHFPATIADLYDPDTMPGDLRDAHERNDEVLERVYIGRRFRNDTERLEKLFDLYTKMTASAGVVKKRKAGASA
jgi:MmeI, target recognition domain/MmeI, C-terminal domain